MSVENTRFSYDSELVADHLEPAELSQIPRGVFRQGNLSLKIGDRVIATAHLEIQSSGKIICDSLEADGGKNEKRAFAERIRQFASQELGVQEVKFK